MPCFRFSEFFPLRSATWSPYCTCQTLSTRLIRAITLKCHSTLWNRLHRCISVRTHFESRYNKMQCVHPHRSIVTSTIPWRSFLSKADVSFIMRWKGVFQQQVLIGFTAPINTALGKVSHLHDTQFIHAPDYAATCEEFYYVFLGVTFSFCSTSKSIKGFYCICLTTISLPWNLKKIGHFPFYNDNCI